MQNCERCGFQKWLKPKTGVQWKWSDGHRVRVWLCAKCEHRQAETPPFHQTPPRILYVDIETSLMQTYTWGLHVPSKYINPALLLTPFFIITWAAMWTDGKKVFSGAVTGSQARKFNDKQCIRELWHLIDAADIVVGHNLDKFDIKRIQTRFIVNNYPRPRQFRTLDTLKIARKYFAFPSNSLEFLSAQFGFNPKDEMHLKDWIDIVERGDEKTIEKMRRYNAGDVREGVKLFEKFLPWIAPFPRRPRDGGYKVEMKEKV